MSARLDDAVKAALDAIIDAPACPQNFSAKQLARVALRNEAFITRAGQSKKFLERATPLEARITTVVKHLVLGAVIKFPLLSKQARKVIADELDMAYRLGHKDGVTDERRNVERYLKVVL